MDCRFINALLRKSVDVTPVWLMRQAGRYLPEYRKTREQAGNFMALCQNPELACEVTLQPLRRFDLDAAILFSDILTIPDAMGLGLYFSEGEGPKFERPVQTAKVIETLRVPDPHESLSYVMEAVKTIRREMPANLPLIGFSGSPWTLACYMVEGGASKTFQTIKTLIYREPELAHTLLSTLADAVTAYLLAQIEAGVQVVQIFDTWGGVLTEPAFEAFSLQYIRKIVQAMSVPTIVFTKGGGAWLEKIAATGCQGVGVDWMTDIGRARERVGDHVALQGNLDPVILFSDEKAIRAEVKRIMDEFGDHPGHVFNLGHGILPGTPPEHVSVLIDAVKTHR
ncbi:MAG: uroporphyrinogen decarboxylase [Gammaproteobacteria bacterium CG11_big_fil_rev_8_21_14_0_20_46_22]|nr:MAG: uroporphyrinogen decarboxylase [Gammaproteobacteria bacterium CG12_big_fil_rev_8_21_14_0_65_46_12]PIR12065.1 MAG: uroporphyrinogen decarboxylase [Gammaproteobacteria bacterium CG11_big_fil_rev_8_21_14_0_20_46_22]